MASQEGPAIFQVSSTLAGVLKLSAWHGDFQSAVSEIVEFIQAALWVTIHA